MKLKWYELQIDASDIYIINRTICDGRAVWPAVSNTAMIFFLTSISAMGCRTSIIVAQEPDDPAVSGAFWPREGNVEFNFELKCLYSLDLLLVFPEKKNYLQDKIVIS